MALLAETMDQAVKAMPDKEGKYLTFSMADEEYGIGMPWKKLGKRILNS